MKFLLFSEAGEGAQILKKIELEGNEVGLYIKEPLYQSVWDGLLPKVKPEDFIDKETIIIFDLSGNGAAADKFKRQGHFVYGGSSWADDLEHDRKFGFDLMEKAGILTPETQEFKDFSKGIDFVRHANKRLVFKPSGSMPCKLTYVSSNAVELESYMTFVERKFGKHIDNFILQEFVEGTVVSTEFFCDGKKFLRPANHTVEVKKSMNDELGPSTGCSGNITWVCEYDDVLTETVEQVERYCTAAGYVGQIDLNAVLTENGQVFGLEWTPRFGYDATPTFMQLIKGDAGKFFSDVARGNGSMDAELLYAGGIRLSIPPYPAEPLEGVDPEEFSPSIGIPIQGYEKYEDNLYFYEVALQDGELVHSSGTGVILCAVGAGETPEKSLEGPEEALKALVIPDKQYRTDLKKVLPEMIGKVKSHAE